jgi:hypothetical protein
MTLNQLTEAVLTISPQLLDSREATTIVESCGITDRIAAGDFGFPDTFALGEHILRHSRATPIVAARQQKPKASFLREAGCAAHKFSLSFAYALPWTLLLIVEYCMPNLLQLTPEWGGVLSLSIIASLISAGGFGQAITRTGYFYIGMKQPKLALRLCLLFAKWGALVCCLLGTMSFLLAHYFGLFPPSHLAWGTVNFLMLSMLWMFCAMLSVQGRRWNIPLIFILGGAVFAVLHAKSSVGVVPSIFIANASALAVGAASAVLGFRLLPSASSTGTPPPALPRLPAVMLMLMPYLLYGVVYFSFLFADRVAAGSAIPWASGLSFGIDSQYKKGMDVGLFIFLVLAAVVEYMADHFMRYWFRLAEEQNDTERIGCWLTRRYRRLLTVLCFLFALLASGLWFAYSRLEPAVLATAVLGSVGYFLVALALFNLIVLCSVNQPERAGALVSVALVCNALTGYILSHLIGVHFAAIGLLVGGFVLFVVSYRTIRVVLQQSAFFYALA